MLRALTLIYAQSKIKFEVFIFRAVANSNFQPLDPNIYNDCKAESNRKAYLVGCYQVTEVDDPTKFGVVVFKANGQVEKFVEKPQTSVSNKINAGLYIFNDKVIHRIEVGFPALTHSN